MFSIEYLYLLFFTTLDSFLWFSFSESLLSAWIRDWVMTIYIKPVPNQSQAWPPKAIVLSIISKHRIVISEFFVKVSARFLPVLPVFVAKKGTFQRNGASFIHEVSTNQNHNSRKLKSLNFRWNWSRTFLV